VTNKKKLEALGMDPKIGEKAPPLWTPVGYPDQIWTA